VDADNKYEILKSYPASFFSLIKANFAVFVFGALFYSTAFLCHAHMALAAQFLC
jgi:hypothetical protein